MPAVLWSRRLAARRSIAAGVAVLALSTLLATPAGAASRGPGRLAGSPAGGVPSGWASVEQNSPPQLVPAPSAALNAMIGSEPRLLRAGAARQAGLLPEPIARISQDVAAGLRPQGAGHHPLFPGAVSLQAHRGVIVSDVAVGYSDLYSDSAPTLLPPEQRIRTRTDTIYDLASLSKLFTSIVAMQLAERGKLDLAAPVARYLPAFAANGKSAITLANLLTHTSGLAPDPAPPLWQLPADQRIPAILAATPAAPPNTRYIYSDLNMMTLALVEQAVTGKPLDTLVAEQITGPLRMTSTLYNPPASLLPRIAAEEYQTVPDRGLVHGQVHDENAWALGGVAGHAGVFSDAHDLAVLAQTLLNGGCYGRARILSKASVVALFTNLNQAFPGDNHGYGFELYQHWYEGALATPYTAGHTGFTGTDLVIDPTTGSFSILLTNAVHPSRGWGSTNPVRRAVTDDLARALPVHPLAGDTAWYSGMVDASTETLTVPLPALAEHARLDFGLWYDTEPTDLLSLRESTDGGASWTTLGFGLSDGRHRYYAAGPVSGYAGHRWYAASAVLPPSSGPVLLRWTYRTDSLYHGRGVYLDRLVVRDATGLRFDDSRPADAARIAAAGFSPSAN